MNDGGRARGEARVAVSASGFSTHQLFDVTRDTDPKRTEQQALGLFSNTWLDDAVVHDHVDSALVHRGPRLVGVSANSEERVTHLRDPRRCGAETGHDAQCFHFLRRVQLIVIQEKIFGPASDDRVDARGEEGVRPQLLQLSHQR